MLSITIKSDSGPITRSQWDEIAYELEMLANYIDPPNELDCQSFTMQWEEGEGHRATYREDYEEKESV